MTSAHPAVRAEVMVPVCTENDDRQARRLFPDGRGGWDAPDGFDMIEFDTVTAAGDGPLDVCVGEGVCVLHTLRHARDSHGRRWLLGRCDEQGCTIAARLPS